MTKKHAILKAHQPGTAEAVVKLCHELSEPLTALGHYLQAARRLERAGGGDPALADILNRAAVEVSRANALVHDLRGTLDGDGTSVPAPAVRDGQTDPQR